jgi:hypothetical protein
MRRTNRNSLGCLQPLLQDTEDATAIGNSTATVTAACSDVAIRGRFRFLTTWPSRLPKTKGKSDPLLRSRRCRSYRDTRLSVLRCHARSTLEESGRVSCGGRANLVLASRKRSPKKADRNA